MHMPTTNPHWIPYRENARSGDYLFRFLSHENLQRFLNTGHLWFARGDSFGDKMECVSVSDFKSNAFDLATMQVRQRSHFISCWHLNTHESLAFWDTYADTPASRRKYAIRFKREDLINLVKSSACPTGVNSRIYGNLIYKNLISADATTLLQSKVKYASFRKDKVFAYEQEFRFVLYSTQSKPEKGLNVYIGKPAALPFRILINPLLSNNDFKQAVRFLNSSNFKDKVAFSKLTKWLNPQLGAIIDKHRIGPQKAKPASAK
jgi:hypothetical protein